MIKVIETNYNPSNGSFQSRVIEVESWKYIVEQFIDDDSISETNHIDCIGGYFYGVIRPKSSKVNNLIYDGSRLSCDVVLYNNIGNIHMIIRKLISLVKYEDDAESNIN